MLTRISGRTPNDPTAELVHGAFAALVSAQTHARTLGSAQSFGGAVAPKRARHGGGARAACRAPVAFRAEAAASRSGALAYRGARAPEGARGAVELHATLAEGPRFAGPLRRAQSGVGAADGEVAGLGWDGQAAASGAIEAVAAALALVRACATGRAPVTSCATPRARYRLQTGCTSSISTSAAAAAAAIVVFIVDSHVSSVIGLAV